jgi:anti-sigma28 factor (negative regulator of flagellin synthesis)
MGHINTTSLPTYAPDTQGVGREQKTSVSANGSAAALELAEPQDDMQLTKLSAVLHSLKKGASAMRNQVSQVMGAVRTGSYQVDALAVSRRIVGDSLAQH